MYIYNISGYENSKGQSKLNWFWVLMYKASTHLLGPMITHSPQKCPGRYTQRDMSLMY